jgi:hypothetical protein
MSPSSAPVLTAYTRALPALAPGDPPARQGYDWLLTVPSGFNGVVFDPVTILGARNASGLGLALIVPTSFVLLTPTFDAVVVPNGQGIFPVTPDLTYGLSMSIVQIPGSSAVADGDFLLLSRANYTVFTEI